MKKYLKIIETLKQLLKSKQMSYAVLAEKMQLSEASVKRIFSEHSFTLDRLEEICDILDVSLFDLILQTQKEEDTKPRYLTLAQEKAIAANEKMLIILYLLLREWTSEEIKQKCSLSEKNYYDLLKQLEELNILRRIEENKVKLLVSRKLHWQIDGPINQLVMERMAKDFLNSEFKNQQEHLLFIPCEISAYNAKIIEEKIKKLSSDIKEFDEFDRYLPKHETCGYAILLGMREWRYFG